MTEYLSELDRWMKENRYSDPEFAVEVSKHTRKPVTKRAVFKWRHKQRVPRGDNMRGITLATGGAITPNSFADLPPEDDA